MTLAVGVDIGGTKILGGVVTEDGEVLATARRLTPGHDAAAVEDTIAELVRELAASWEIGSVGVGAAGWVDRTRSRVLFSPHLAWRDEPLRDALTERLGLPVVVENDATAMAAGEHRFGAGRGVHDLVCITVGTGIGGGVVLGGRLYRGGFGMAGEFGHVRVVPDGRECPCGNRGCWEQYVSGRALATAAGVDEEEGEGVTAAALAGDPAALVAFAEVGGWLGQGLADLTAVLDPTRFVIGGGVIEAGELLLAPARERYAQVLSGRGFRPEAEVVAAQLGPLAGLVGAAELSREACA